MSSLKNMPDDELDGLAYRQSFSRANDRCSKGVPLCGLKSCSLANLSRVSGKASTPWSLSASSFPLLDPDHLEPCSSFAALTDAVSRGRRLPLEPKRPTANLAGGIPSRFQPTGCSIPFVSGARACSALHNYSLVVVYGDSIMRLMAQGLLALLTGDLAHGAAPLLSSWDSADSNAVHHTCACDAQFAEDAFCRRWQEEGRAPGASSRLWSPFSLGAAMNSSRYKLHGGACAAARKLLYVSAFMGFYSAPDAHPKLYEWRDALCSGKPGLPAVLLLQTGPQVVKNQPTAHAGFARNVQPVLAIASRAARECNRPLRLLWTGNAAQLKERDALFPRQARGFASAYDREVWNLTVTEWPDVRKLDFWELTTGALTADGLHQLGDINLAKANVLLSALELMAAAV